MIHFNALVICIMIIMYIPLFITLVKKKCTLERHIIFLLFYVYAGLAVKEVFFPIPIFKSSLKVYKMISPGVKFNFIPFKTITDIIINARSGILLQIGGNILLFMPLGFLLPLIAKTINSFKKVMLVSLIISISIELVQLACSIIYGFTYKYCDIDDVILNTLGGVLGFLILKLCSHLFSRNK